MPVIRLDNQAQLNKWDKWIRQGKTVRYNEKKQTLERVGILGRFRLFFARGAAKKIDQKVLEVVGNALRSQYNTPADRRGEALFLGDALNTSKRMRKSSSAQAAQMERYLVGVKRSQLGDMSAHYTQPKNLAFFEADELQRDPRLLGTTQEYAESHPDFVEFALNNNISYQKARTNAKEEMNFDFLADGTPLLKFVDRAAGEHPFAESDLTTTVRTWDETKAYLNAEGLIKAEDSTLTGHHMTRWGLLRQESFMWDQMTPITKIAPPATPCFQIASYHPGNKLIPGLLDEQGHSGMVFVDKDGYVYSCGFYCHPDSYFYAALKPQASAIRSPDLYEARVDINWQSIARNGKKSPKHTPPRWNDGILQFNFEDDKPAYPCVEAVMRTWKAKEATIAEGETKEMIRAKVSQLNAALAADSQVGRIHRLSDDIFGLMLLSGVKDIKGMTADEKFNAMMERVHDLQSKTVQAIKTGDWSNGAFPYMLAENNCTHVSRYYFGQYAEVNLGTRKTANIVNTRPSQEGEFLPHVSKSPFSRWKWAKITVNTIILGRIMRVLSLTPILATRWLGRGKAGKGFKPKTSILSCARNFFRGCVSPQQVREEGMRQQFKIKSISRSVASWALPPSGMLPIYRR